MIKSWQMPALLFVLVSFHSQADSLSLINSANQQKLSQSPKWSALLHLKNGTPQINDPKFILSLGDFSVNNELFETIKLIVEQPAIAKCRFPARYQFLSNYLKIDKPDYSFITECPEFNTYINSVPFDQLNLIFASEVLSSASSMMGHTFLNAEGNNSKSHQVSHSISFFTEFSSFNPTSLIYDGLIGGMDGFLLVRPYQVDYEHYLNDEQRNVWSYNLKLTNEDKLLIKLHLWELKDVDIEYLFQSYNCATLTLYVLSLAEPSLRNEESLFVSPLDVVKAANKYGMIKQQSVSLASAWEISMLSQAMNSDIKKQIDRVIFKGETLDLTNYSNAQLFKTKRYLALLLKQPTVLENVDANLIKKLNSTIDKLPNNKFSLDLTQYKNPLNTPQDSLLSAQYNFTDHEKFLTVNFLPASHYLTDDNRQYFSESELRIAELALRYSLDRDYLTLHEATLYAVKSYNPTSTILPYFSGEFYFGYRHKYIDKLKIKGMLEISGAIGKTYKIHQDFLLYSLLGISLATNMENKITALEPKVGAIINLIGDSKLHIEHEMVSQQLNFSSSQKNTLIKFSWFGLNDVTFNTSLQINRNKYYHNKTFSLGAEFHF